MLDASCASIRSTAAAVDSSKLAIVSLCFIDERLLTARPHASELRRELESRFAAAVGRGEGEEAAGPEIDVLADGIGEIAAIRLDRPVGAAASHAVADRGVEKAAGRYVPERIVGHCQLQRIQVAVTRTEADITRSDGERVVAADGSGVLGRAAQLQPGIVGHAAAGDVADEVLVLGVEVS